MTGADDGLMRHGGKSLQTFVHQSRVRAGQVGATAALQKKCVTRDQSVRDAETLASGGVARGVHERDVDLADRDFVAALMLDQIFFVDSRRAHDPLCFVLVDVNRHLPFFEQRRDALDVHAHHRAADMVGVVVGGEHAGQSHFVVVDDLHDFTDGISRVDHDALASLPVTDQIDEIDHLLG